MLLCFAGLRSDQVEDSSGSSSKPKKSKPNPQLEKNLTPQQRVLLQNIFAANENISVDEAKDIAQRRFGGTVHHSAVLNWFIQARYKKEHRAKMRASLKPKLTLLKDVSIVLKDIFLVQAAQCSVPEPPSTSQAVQCTVVDHHHSQSQLRMLFETFKLFPYPSPSCIAKLSSWANLSQNQVETWFREMHGRLKLVSDAILLSTYRNSGLTDKQVEALESEFQQNPYESTETRGKLAKELKLESTLIERWFDNRRDYELISLVGQTLNSSVDWPDPAIKSEVSDCRPDKELMNKVVANGSKKCQDVADASRDVVVVDLTLDDADVKTDFSCDCIDVEAFFDNIEKIGSPPHSAELMAERKVSFSNDPVSSTSIAKSSEKPQKKKKRKKCRKFY